jgi:uncharacterized protein (TIGR03083 family)
VQLTPRYDGPPILVTAAPAASPAVPLLRQRRRLADLLGGLTDEQWAAQSRCDAWTVQDVVLHLISTNQFWTFSLGAGLAGDPTRFLATFDPVATPAALVDDVRGRSPADTLGQYDQSVDALASVIDGIGADQWGVTGEAPPGHVALELVGWHALWDAWVHERDIAIPLGLPVVVEPDEVAGSLRYAVALSPTFSAASGSDRTGALGLVVTDPDVAVTIDAGPTVVIRDEPPSAGTPTITGDAVEVLEALSYRAPISHDLGPDHAWLLSGLAEVFDRA